MDSKGPLFLVFGIVIALLIANIAESILTDVNTVAGSQVNSVVANGSGAGTMALSNAHWYTTTKDMTITGATDGDVTANVTVGADRKTLSITGLTASSTQNITAAFLKEGTDDFIILLKAVPFLLVIGGLGMAFASAFTGIKQGVSGSGGGGMSSMFGFIVVFVGIILIKVVTSFTDDLDATYSIAPEYTGVTSVITMVTIGYVIGLFGFAFTAAAPTVKKVTANF